MNAKLKIQKYYLQLLTKDEKSSKIKQLIYQKNGMDYTFPLLCKHFCIEIVLLS